MISELGSLKPDLGLSYDDWTRKIIFHGQGWIPVAGYVKQGDMMEP
jgi:hypothetical protein